MGTCPDSIPERYNGRKLPDVPGTDDRSNIGYLTPYHHPEPLYAELSQTFEKQPIPHHDDEHSQLEPLRPTPHCPDYITPVPEGGNGAPNCERKATFLFKLLISAFGNIALIILLVIINADKCFMANCSKNPSPTEFSYQSSPATEGLAETELCFFAKDMQCNGGLLRKSHGGVQSQSLERSSVKTDILKEVTLMCCYSQSQSIQNLANLFLLVKTHNRIRRVDTKKIEFFRTSELSVACKIVVSSDQRLKLYKKKDCSNGIQVKRTRMHFFYLYLVINCSMHGNNAIRAGVQSQKEVVVEKEMICDPKLGTVTLSVFSFKKLEQGTILEPFVSHTNCVYSDKVSNSNRLEMLTL